MTIPHYDVAVVGGGIVGAAHALQAARRGKRVVLIERDDRPVGASIRNFGMIWPIGQASSTLPRALRSREYWRELAREIGFWTAPTGSLHLAYTEEEWAVLVEFADTANERGYQVELLTPARTVERSPATQPSGLLGGLYSHTELTVDPRQVLPLLHKYLRDRMGVHCHYRQTIREIRYPHLRSATQTWAAERIVVAGGDEFGILYPELLAKAPLTRCKLQMMRTIPQPSNWQFGPPLAAGLTLLHYPTFAHCQSLPVLRERLRRELPDYQKYGIHVLVARTALGELSIGDSHEYGFTLSPFNKEEINRLILTYFKQFAQIPYLKIKEYWQGTYAKLTNGASELVLQPEPGVLVVTGLGGGGLTLSFGLAEEVMLDRYRQPTMDRIH